MSFFRFLAYALRNTLVGSKVYYAWMGFLLVLSSFGVWGFYHHITVGLITTGMRDQVSWGISIGTYAFLIGVATSVIILLIPGYIYNWKPAKNIVIVGEILALSALTMCILFVMTDIGRPERFWHMLPFLGILNLPSSLMGWNAVVMPAYFFFDLFIIIYILYKAYVGKGYNEKFVYGYVIFMIFWAIVAHSITAFIFNVLPAHPYWNASILVPRFIATALASGGAILLLVLQMVRKIGQVEIDDEAVFKIADILNYVMFLNLLLFLSEVIMIFTSENQRFTHMRYYFVGLRSYAWVAIFCNFSAYFLLMFRKLRENYFYLNIACVFIFIGIFIEKGIGLVIPGYIPTPLGEVYHYTPTLGEWAMMAGISGIGLIVATVFLKIAIPLVMTSKTSTKENKPTVDEPASTTPVLSLGEQVKEEEAVGGTT